jgi:serine/threonine protein kinase
MKYPGLRAYGASAHTPGSERWGGVGGVDSDAPGMGAFLVSFSAGTRIGGYRLENQIGRGGMAIVYRARDERLGRLVALKILAPTLAGDAEFRQRFVSESRAAAAIDDPHIVPVFEAGEADGVLFIAMRYVPGGDGHSLLRREGPLPPGRVTEIISPMASALDAAHRAGLLHRDVKPSNMLMDIVPGRPDHVYLSDFGLSKAVTASSGMTRVGQVMGTPDYLSPEQIAGQPADARADQYALACSAFELLTGTLPFHRDDPMAVVNAHMSEPPPLVTSRQPGLPRAVDGVLSKALAKAPGDRYASCGQFADALRYAFGFQPYDSGPRVASADTHPPTAGWWQAAPPPRDVDTKTALPAAVADATGPRQVWPGSASDGSASDGSASDGRVSDGRVSDGRISDGSASDGRISDGRISDGSASGGSAGDTQRRRRRRIVIAAVAAVIVLAGALTAGLLAGSTGVHHPVVVPLSAKSAEPLVTSDVWVAYNSGKYSTAEIDGTIKKAVSGEVAQLYAQPFPFSRAPVQVQSVILHPAGGAASYQFQVTPTLATRYQVKLFASSTASAPAGTSATTTVYVASGGSTSNSKTCSRPVCHQTFTESVEVPPSALPTELAKPWYVYLGLNLAPVKEPSAPKWFVLGAGNGQITGTHRISAAEFTVTITYSFQVGNNAYNWNWFACVKDSLAQDGIGLPGDHGCGAARVPSGDDYIG